ncbi:MAG: hypothetical protein ACF8OB_12100 [Phycisphaeraceae bacterium JB051]
MVFRSLLFIMTVVTLSGCVKSAGNHEDFQPYTNRIVLTQCDTVIVNREAWIGQKEFFFSSPKPVAHIVPASKKYPHETAFASIPKGTKAKINQIEFYDGVDSRWYQAQITFYAPNMPYDRQSVLLSWYQFQTQPEPIFGLPAPIPASIEKALRESKSRTN